MDTVTKFRKQSSVTISRNLAVFLLVLFAVCLVATGLLFYNISSCDSYINSESKSPVVNCDTDEDISVKEESDVSTSTQYVESSTTTTTTSTSESSVQKTEHFDIRLPKSVAPHHYKLELVSFLQEGNFTFKGEVVITVDVLIPCDNITLHSEDLKIKSVVLHDSNKENVSIKNTRNITKAQFLIVELHTELQTGRYFLTIVFEGVLNDMMEGFYRSSYTENNRKRWIASTQFQPTDARKAFPCFDEPALKARFQINIVRLKNMTSVSNMRRTKVTKTVQNLPDYEVDHYEETPPMSTYLLAFMVTDFKSISNGTFSVWARSGAVSQARHSLSIGPKVLKFYEEFFGIKYPLPKVDMAAIPDFAAGAMENWGLITYRESLLLFKEGVSSRQSLQRIGHIVAHELAHQWFGNLVTPTWWTDLWLNEGFATYVEYLGADAVAPEWKNIDLFVTDELHASLSLDALKTSHQISIPVNDPLEINDIFDTISYSKGASVIRMMQYFLTDEVFHKGLKKYLTSRLYKAAEQDDLWRSLTEQSHEDNILHKNVTVKDIMDTWTLQTGYPVVTVKRNYKENRVTFEQERFYKNDENKGNDSVLWWVPITFTDKTGVVKRTWLEKQRQTVITNTDISSDDWLLVNVNQTGYYRVNYDINNWKIIIDQLRKKDGHLVFDPKNRAQIINDLLNLAYSGYVSYDLALNATLYLHQEREYLPWKTGWNNLQFLNLMFQRSVHFDKYKNYMLSLTKGFYKELGFNEIKDPIMMLNQLELINLACELGMRECIIKAVQLFQNWKNSANPNADNTIPRDLRSTVYCTAIGDGGQEEWDFTWQRYLKTNVASEKELLLTALGCTKEVWLLHRYLEWSITENSGIRKHDTSLVFVSVSANPIGFDLTYRFLKTNWDRIRTYLGPLSPFLGTIISTSITHMNTEMEVNDFKAFLNLKYDELGLALRSTLQTLEECEANVKWMNKYFNSVVNWLSKAVI